MSEHELFQDVVELAAAALQLAEHRVDALRLVHPGLPRDGRARGGAEQQLRVGVERLIVHLRAAGVLGHAAQQRAADRQLRRVRAAAGEDRILIGVGRLVLAQDGRVRHAVLHKHMAHERPFRPKAARIGLRARNLPGEFSPADGVSPGGKHPGRKPLRVQARRQLARLGVAVAGNEDHVRGPRRILQKDEVGDLPDPFKHGGRPPLRPA